LGEVVKYDGFEVVGATCFVGLEDGKGLSYFGWWTYRIS
jgi:hypothetical protein